MGGDGEGGFAGAFGPVWTVSPQWPSFFFAAAQGSGGFGFDGVGGTGPSAAEAFIQLQGITVAVSGDTFV